MINDDIRLIHTAAKTISDYCAHNKCSECYFLDGTQIHTCMLDRIFSKSAMPFDYEENMRRYITKKEKN